jgi:23S rRNA (pseudouridine1915-N3)-methyltransferase
LRIAILAVSRRRPGWLGDALDEYLRRFPPDQRPAIIDVAPAKKRDAGREIVLADEARRIRAALPGNARCIVLDETGRPQDTRAIARHLGEWRQDGRDVAFVVGGSEGTDPALRREAEAVWSLSPLTLPHGLALLVLVEQLYRAWTLLGGHPYHRGE